MATTEKDKTVECKVYKRRWLMLALFILSSIGSYMQWIEYSIIADVIVEFYGISYETANWSALSFLVLFVPFIFPGVYLIHKLGVRKSLLLATCATCLGAWIKVGAVNEDRYWVYMIGQLFVGVFQVIICALPVSVAAAWFPENEVSTACGLSVFGLQLGVAIGFVVPPMIVHNNDIREVTERELYTLSIGVAVLCSVVLIITYVVFEENPSIPPSLAKMHSKYLGDVHFGSSLLRIISNTSYMVLLIAYGINVGIFYGISMLLNQIILKYYPDAAEDAGRIGVIIVVAGMVGAIVFGIIMDKFHKFKETTFAVYVGCFLSFVAFAAALPYGLLILYITTVIFGFFTTGLIPVGYEVAVELTFPEPECISSGVVQIVAQVVGIGYTYLYSYLFYNMGDFSANIATAGLLLLSSIMVLFVRFDLKRRKAQSKENITTA